MSNAHETSNAKPAPTSNEGDKEALNKLLAPVWKLVWPASHSKTEEEDDVDEEDEIPAQLWLNFFHSRGVTSIADLAMFDFEHFRIMQHVFERFRVEELRMFDKNNSSNAKAMSRLSKICFYIQHYGEANFFESIHDMNETNMPEKWEVIQAGVNRTLFPFDEHTQDLYHARMKLRHCFQQHKIRELLDDTVERGEWQSSHGAEVLKTLKEFPILACEPCHENLSHYPFSFFLWAGFPKDILEKVHALFPLVMSHTQEQGGLETLMENLVYDYFHRIPMCNRALFEIYPELIHITWGPYSEEIIPFLEALIHFYNYDIDSISISCESGDVLEVHFCNYDRPMEFSRKHWDYLFQSFPKLNSLADFFWNLKKVGNAGIN